MEINVLFLFLLFVVAILYSSVGHGGASGYLALMALFGVSIVYMRFSALTLNLFVSAVSFLVFYKGGHFKPKILLPFIIGSVPMAFLGARVNIDPTLFKYMLGSFLMIAIFRMFYNPKTNRKEIIQFNTLIAFLIGTILGFISGLIGIGGGIILSPILLLFGWANVKQTAAISAAFIFINSLSGLFGMISVGISLNNQLIFWIIAAFIGGVFGAYLGSFRFTILRLKYLLAVVLLLASIKLYIF